MPQETSRPSRRNRLLRMLTWRCFCHGCSLCLFVVQIALAGLALLLGYVLLRDDIPVPDILHGRIEQELARLGLEATFDGAQFDPTGRLFVRGLRLQPSIYTEPLFEADRVFIQLDRLNLLAGRPVLKIAEAEGVRLLCPPSISPSGVAETLLQISSVRVTHDDGAWTIDGLVGALGPVLLSGHGTYTPAPRRAAAPPPDVEKILALYAREAPRIVRMREWLEHAAETAIDIGFSGTGDQIRANVALRATDWRDERFGEAVAVRFETSVSLSGGKPSLPLRADLSLEGAQRNGVVAVRRMSAALWWDAEPSAKQPFPDRVELAVDGLAHPKLDLPRVAAVVRPKAFPQVFAEVWLPFEDIPLTIDVQADVASRGGTATIHGRLGRNWLAKASEIIGRDVTYYATIDEPPDFAATAHIDPGLKWSRIDGRLLSGPVIARGVALDRVRVLGTITPTHVDVPRLEMSRGDEHAAGTYRDTLATRENRFLLRGAMRPQSISPWFGAWWGRFWSDYGFHAEPPGFDIDVRGNWKEGHKNVVTGRMSAEAVTIHEHPFNSVASHFFIRPNYYDLYDATLRRTEGQITGEVQLYFRPGDRIPARQSWQLESTTDLVALADIFGPGGVDLFEAYRYEVPPAVKGRGRITQEDGRYDTDIALSIHTDNAFRYWDFPLDAVATDVTIRNRHVELPDLHARYAEGTITGRAVADEGRLTFDGALTDADYDLAVETFRAFLDRRSPPPPEEQEASGFSARKVGGRLDLKLSAVGPLTEYTAYEGSGEAQIREGDLAKVNLFGPLGDALGGIGIKLGTLSLHEASGNFEVRREKLVFPKIRFTGRTGRLESEGTYWLPDGSVDFKARLFPLRESSGLFAQFFGIMLEPLSNLLEMRLTGTLRKPHWSFTRDPRSILRDLTARKEAEEAAKVQEAQQPPPQQAPTPAPTEPPVESPAPPPPPES